MSDTITIPSISQSLIKEAMKKDHCPKQLFYAFVEGRELIDPSEAMLLGKYFESELLGACRGGEKHPAKLLKNGEKATAYRDVDEIVLFAKDVFKKLGLGVNPEKVQLEVKADYLSGHLDLVSNDIRGEVEAAIYDVKYTQTKEDDRWNGWGNPESKDDAIIQACHYVLTYHKRYGIYPPFYFLVFGKDKWVKVIQFKMTEDVLNKHKERIRATAELITHYAEEGYKGNGSFNKCLSCPFYNDCPDKAQTPQIETYYL